MKIIVVIPTFNEKRNVRELIAAIRTEMKSFDLDILIVDSASPDGTAGEIREIQKTDGGLFLFEQSAKMGLGKAYLDGMRWALDRSYDCLITMDADLSHNPRYLPQIIQEMETHELVIGSRYVRGGGLEDWPAYRLFLSRFANWYASSLTGLPFHDLTSGFQCFRTSLLRNILRYNIHTEGYAFLVELKFLAIMQKARYVEVPIMFSDRTKGNSKISKRVIAESVLFVLARALQRSRVKHILRALEQSSPQ